MIRVSGTANLVLVDDAVLIANGTSSFGIDYAGIGVGSGNALAIFGQQAGTGRIVATGIGVRKHCRERVRWRRASRHQALGHRDEHLLPAR